MRDEDQDRVETTEPGRRGPGEHSEPGDAGEPISDDPGAPSGAPGEVDEPDTGGPNPSPRREQPGL
jgi:hypothetical protein